MNIRIMSHEEMQRLVDHTFPKDNLSVFLEKARFSQCVACQFDHSEIELFRKLAFGMSEQMRNVLSVSLFDRQSLCEDCNATEELVVPLSMYHETVIVNNKYTPGTITVAFASLISPKCEDIDYYIHLVSNRQD